MSASSQGDLSSSLSSSATISSTTTPSSRSRSGSRTPQSNTHFPESTASYFSYPVTHVVSGIYRRLKDPNNNNMNSNKNKNNKHNHVSSSLTTTSGVFTPVRTASPFQPPPLTPLTLPVGPGSLQQQLLTRALAEEVRLLVPARLQLVDTWRLAYSLDRDGASLATLYENCRTFSHRSPRAGYVLIVRDSSPSGSVFGAYMTDPPRPGSHYFGTGECFLWRASVLRPPNFSTQGEHLLEMAGLPLPPSADTTHAGRSTTVRRDNYLSPSLSNGGTSGTSTLEQIRFKAFPYSGVNDYMIFCETGFLSLGGGDGHFGLWLDSSLEKGVSQPCQTFGNEILSDEGIKFDILGVEVWYVGA